MKQPKIVTRDTLQHMLDTGDMQTKITVVGRACVALFKLQTEAEKAVNATNNTNGVGFSQSDAKRGSLAAKTFLKRSTLHDFQLEIWLKPQRNGYAKITKYARQLNDVAIAKRAAAEARAAK
jgi:hypothetical protein